MTNYNVSEAPEPPAPVSCVGRGTANQAPEPSTPKPTVGILYPPSQ